MLQIDAPKPMHVELLGKDDEPSLRPRKWMKYIEKPWL